MKTIYLDCWEDFEREIQELKPSSAHEFGQFRFRGQENANWRLATTLEREWGEQFDLKEYYRAIYRMRGDMVESVTGNRWPVPTLTDAFGQIEKIWDYYVENGDRIPASEYMAYLRHHGYPSPFLDWSSSPYVAAYFAFQKRLNSGCENVAIFAFSEMPNGGKAISERPEIYYLNANITTHRRHFLQQSKYTICFRIERTGASDHSAPQINVLISPYEFVFVREESEWDLLCKFILPSRERDKVLRKLDRYNLNAFSLFGGEDALMETLANRQRLFRNG